MQSPSVYIGIDVACAVNKRLPICVVSAGSQLKPLHIPKVLSNLIPRGLGNREISKPEPFLDAARGVANAITQIVKSEKWQIERIAVDAPAVAPLVGPRKSERELSRHGLSSFQTPEVSAWSEITDECINHLRRDGTVATLPHANKIWMRYGFELFASLRKTFGVEVIEVFPYAIIRELLKTCEHKSTEKGYQDQLTVIAAHTGWKPENLEKILKTSVFGSRHDKLDAFMAAWVASLSPNERRAYGDAQNPNDAIWVPCARSHLAP